MKFIIYRLILIQFLVYSLCYRMVFINKIVLMLYPLPRSFLWTFISFHLISFSTLIITLCIFFFFFSFVELIIIWTNRDHIFSEFWQNVSFARDWLFFGMYLAFIFIKLCLVNILGIFSVVFTAIRSHYCCFWRFLVNFFGYSMAFMNHACIFVRCSWFFACCELLLMWF